MKRLNISQSINDTVDALKETINDFMKGGMRNRVIGLRTSYFLANFAFTVVLLILTSLLSGAIGISILTVFSNDSSAIYNIVKLLKNNITALLIIGILIVIPLIIIIAIIYKFLSVNLMRSMIKAENMHKGFVEGLMLYFSSFKDKENKPRTILTFLATLIPTLSTLIFVIIIGIILYLAVIKPSGLKNLTSLSVFCITLIILLILLLGLALISYPLSYFSVFQKLEKKGLLNNLKEVYRVVLKNFWPLSISYLIVGIIMWVLWLVINSILSLARSILIVAITNSSLTGLFILIISVVIFIIILFIIGIIINSFSLLFYYKLTKKLLQRLELWPKKI